jgi:quinol monooxygenase YgiN
MAYFKANPTLLGSPPIVATSETAAAFTRPAISDVADPFILYASIEYKDGKRAESVQGWNGIASESEKNESETLSYGYYLNKDHPETIKVVEIYTTLQYFKEVHFLSKAVKENKERWGDEVRVSMKHGTFKLVAGYLAK